MDELFRHLDDLTSHRDRVGLETALTEAVFNLLAAERVRLYRLYQAGEDFLCGVATQLDPDGLALNDDDMAWPPGTTALAHYPLLGECLETGSPVASHDENRNFWRHGFPIRLAGHETFGLLSVRREKPLLAREQDLVEGLIRVFCNCMGLLQYSQSDTLTGLLNRKTFDEFLFRILSSLKPPGDDTLELPRTPHRRQPRESASQHWLGVMDIDRFKRINDQYGHLIGDEVLVMLANRMRESFRGLDKLFRFGGEEFVVVLKPTEHDHAVAVFERFRERVAQVEFPQVGQVTISIGFAPIGLKDTASVILDNADRALYWAKENGRNRTASYLQLVDDQELIPTREPVHDVELF